MTRRWFKIWIEEWENGSIRVDMNSAERGFWADMISCAMKSRVEGLLCRDSKGLVPYTPAGLAKKYDLPLDIVESTIAKRLKDESIFIDDNGVIHLVNVWKYQSKIEKTNGNKPDKKKSRTDIEKSVKGASFAITCVNKAWEMIKEGKDAEAGAELTKAMSVSPDAASKHWNELMIKAIKHDQGRGARLNEGGE